MLGSILVMVHTEVSGLVPGWGAYGRQPIDVSLSLSLSLSPLSSLSKVNKHPWARLKKAIVLHWYRYEHSDDYK